MLYSASGVLAALLAKVVKFGEFELDCKRYELLRAGRRIKLQKLPMELLILLLEKEGQLVTREEIIDRLWGEGVFLDTEHGINTAIRKIRLVLKDDPDRPRFVQTVSGKGYRFVADLTNGNGAKSVLSAVEAASGPQLPVAVPEISTNGAAGSRKGVALTLLILALGALTYVGWRFLRGVPKPTKHVMVAVLPFENITGDPGQDYFSDGFTEEVITQLGALSPERLGVIARTTSMMYKHTSKSVQQIGQELGVDYVLESSVRRDGDQVRVAAQLIRTRDQVHIWAQSYDRHITRSIALQDEIARSVSSEISVKLTPEERRSLARRRAVDAEAHSEYLQGLYYGSKSGANVVAAVTHFKNSIQRDPTFAPAYAQLAINYLDLRDSGGPPLTELLSLAKTAAAKALELDPSLPQAHLALGLLAQGDYNWSEAEVQYGAALTLNPNCAECHHEYGVFLEGMGRNEEAVVQVKQAIELDPMSSDNRNQLALISFTARQFDLAISQFESLGEAAWWAPLALSYVEKNRFDEALAASKNCEVHWGSDFCLVVQSRIYCAWGRPRDARKAIDRLKEISHHRYVYPTFFSGAYLAAGDKEQALTWMERAYDERDPALFWLKVWPSNDLLHSEPRFQALIQKLNFPQ